MRREAFLSEKRWERLADTKTVGVGVKEMGNKKKMGKKMKVLGSTEIYLMNVY